jgi:ATP-binding cassette subfamily B protein
MISLQKLWHHLSSLRKKQFFLLLILMLLASLAEVVSIGSILPFLAALTSPEQLYNHYLMQPLVKFLEINSPDQLILPLTIIFIAAALLAGLIRLMLLYATTRLSFAAGADLSINIYSRTLYQDYSVHIARNSSEVINGIITKTDAVIGSIINPVLVLISSIILLLGITIVLFSISSTVALIASVGFGLIYWVVIMLTSKQLKENSQCIADQSTNMIKSLQEGLGGIRDILIDGSQKFYCQLYRDSDAPFRKASGSNQFINGSPRFAMEAIGMILIAGLAYSLSGQKEGVISVIPVLGSLALGAQRLLPALQQAYSSYSSINSGLASLKDVVDLLEQPIPKCSNIILPAKPIEFKKEIKLSNIGFRYSIDMPYIIKGINLIIKKGSRVGFIGETGSGKSTLIDVVMGLLSATNGRILIDKEPITRLNNRSWQAHIAHVPQHIYLSDSTIEKNIAFGVPEDEIDHNRVVKAAEQAQIAGLIKQWKEGYQTLVGERGIRISGGQRQRIGIARALYKQADVLIFDEATSALDSGTEYAVMKAIDSLEKELTILIIAHRLTTLKGCDQIVKLEKNSVTHVGKYQDIINT